MCPTPSNHDRPDTQSLLCSLPLSFANFSASGLCAPATFLATADTNLSTFASKYTGSLPTCSPAALAPPPAPAISAATSDTPAGPKAQPGGGANAGAIAGGLTRAVSQMRTEPAICPAADGDGCPFVRASWHICVWLSELPGATAKSGSWAFVPLAAMLMAQFESSGSNDTYTPAGGVVGGVVALAVLAALLLLIRRRRRRKASAAVSNAARPTFLCSLQLCDMEHSMCPSCIMEHVSSAGRMCHP